MKKTGIAITYLIVFYIVGIVFNTFNLIDYNAPIIIDIIKAAGLCIAISFFLRLIRFSWDSAFFTGILFLYIASFVIMFMDTESSWLLINFIVAIVLSVIFTKK